MIIRAKGYVLYNGNKSARRCVIIPDMTKGRYFIEEFERMGYSVASDVVLNLIQSRKEPRGVIAFRGNLGDIERIGEQEAIDDLRALPYGSVILRERPRPNNFYQELLWRRQVVDHVPARNVNMTYREIMRLKGFPDDVPFSLKKFDIDPAFLTYIAKKMLVSEGWWRQYTFEVSI